jgi:hypothetical protein
MIPLAPQRGVMVGESVLALVLNGLGFVSRPLYLTPAFFETKPEVDRFVKTVFRPFLST